MVESCFLIGIDFGTTYSGVAWAKYPNRHGKLEPDDIHVITDWPGGRNSSKVRTQILYKPGREPKCGNEIPDEESPLKWFKLLLVKEQELPGRVKDSEHIKTIRQAQRRLEQEGKDIVEVIADYLRFLWRHTTAAIERAETRATANATRYVVMLTFPAIWKPDAVKKMRDAAELAGILDERPLAEGTYLDTVEEPEAAALATYSDLSDTLHPVFKTGETFVVLDAGGGTCDTITYEVKATRPLQLKECVRGDGDLCGAIFLDDQFKAKLEGWVGRSKINAIGPQAYKALVEDGWERVLKRDYDGEDKEWQFPAPREWTKKSKTRFIPFVKRGDAPKIRDHALNITNAQMKEVWNLTLSQILELVQEQVGKATASKGRRPKGILLAGGLGGNRYLFEFLKKQFDDIEILQRPESQSWSAICRGAVFRAKTVYMPQDNTEWGFNEGPEGVVTRKAKLSYGIAKFTPFIDGYHLEQDRHPMKSHGRDMAINQMQWYVQRDDDMDDREPHRMNWKRYLPIDKPQPNISVELWSCQASPPSRKTHEVSHLCTIEADLPPWDDLPTHQNPAGENWRVVNFDLLMTPQGNSLQWSVWINGRKQGEETTDIIYH